MRYETIPAQPDTVIWIADDGASGVVHASDTSAWEAYLRWCEAGNTAHPIGEMAITLEQAKAQATSRLYAGVDLALQPILSQYPAVEVASWSQQLDEAQAWTADPTVATPMLDALQGERDKATLCQTIIAKAAAYKVASGHVFAWRHACSVWIEACTDVVELTSWQPQFPEVPNAAH